MDAHHDRSTFQRGQPLSAGCGSGADWRDERAALLAELDAARRSAADSVRQRDELLSAIAHELRGPLNSIFGWAQLLQGGRLDAGQQKRALDAIVRGTQAQTRLVDELLEISRALGGRLQLSRSRLDVAQAVQGAVDAIIERAAAKGVMVETFVDVGVYVQADPPRLRQLFGHLLDNAVRCTPQGGAICVRLGGERDMAIIRITDTGVGIDPAALPQIFEPFQRGERAGERSAGRGLGVGLAMARQIARLHGGSIDAQSEGCNRGAAFTVRLPLAVQTDEPHGRKSAPEHGLRDSAQGLDARRAERQEHAFRSRQRA